MVEEELVKLALNGMSVDKVTKLQVKAILENRGEVTDELKEDMSRARV